MRIAVSGFSLVELSIVLVILGLLTGGILTGQSVIRSAELRAVPTEFQHWQTSVRTFQQKYHAMPGDMTNATQFWGSASGTSCVHGTVANGAGTQTCNGDGNGTITYKQWGNNEYLEMFMFWQHLANAGLIDGTYSGRSGPSGVDHAVIGTNVPASRLSGAGWSILDDIIRGHHAFATNTQFGFENSGWPLIFGGQWGSYELYDAVINPQEAWNIDKKIDDGMAGSGIIVTDNQNIYGCVSYNPPYNYDLSRSDTVCRLYFRH